MEQIYHHMATPQERDITLQFQGNLQRFGHGISVVAATPMAAISAASVLIDGFGAVLRRGRYMLYDDAGRAIKGADLARPCASPRLILTPEYSGGNRGKGKALLGLTLLGLSFVPGASQGLSQSFTSLGQSLGGAKAGAAFGSFGGQLLGRSGALLLLAGAAEMLAPQDQGTAGRLPSHSLAPPQVTGQGAPMPLAYGTITIHRPTIISSGLSIETETQ